MKKFASLVLALVMCMGLATTAFAAPAPTVNGEDIVITVPYDMTEYVTITCKGKMTENVEITTKEGTITVTRIDLQPGSTISVDMGTVGVPYRWDSDLNAYHTVQENAKSLSSGVVDDQFGSVTTWEEKTCQVDAYYANAYDEWDESDYIYWFVLGDGQSSTSTSTATSTPATPGTYTAVQYDTWGQIALNNYGTYGVWKQLYKANNYAKLTKGTVINLPETLGNYARIEAPVAAEGETLYTVKAGDTLGAIAKTVYGDVMKYKEIFERNSDRLKNANTIYEGQVIVLPAK